MANKALKGMITNSMANLTNDQNKDFVSNGLTSNPHNIRSFGEFEINQAATRNNQVNQSHEIYVNSSEFDLTKKVNILDNPERIEEHKIVIQSQDFSVDGKSDI